MFEPERVAYDSDEGLLRLFATDGVILVRCAVSKAALTALEDDALAGPHAMVITYRRNRERIQAIAQRKYLRRRFEPGRQLVIRLQDVKGQAATSAEERGQGQSLSPPSAPSR
jgi:hypothetical protein